MPEFFFARCSADRRRFLPNPFFLNDSVLKQINFYHGLRNVLDLSTCTILLQALSSSCHHGEIRPHEPI